MADDILSRSWVCFIISGNDPACAVVGAGPRWKSEEASELCNHCSTMQQPRERPTTKGSEHATAPRPSNNKRVRTCNSPASVQQWKGQRWVLATGYNRIIFHILKEEPELPEPSWPQSPARYEWTRCCCPSHRHGHISRVCPTLIGVPHTHGRASHWQVCPTLTGMPHTHKTFLLI